MSHINSQQNNSQQNDQTLGIYRKMLENFQHLKHHQFHFEPKYAYEKVSPLSYQPPNSQPTSSYGLVIKGNSNWNRKPY
jgi:hypothetical protein